MRQTKRLPSEFESIAILVEKIKYPQLSLEKLADKLKGKNLFIEPEAIENLFLHHGLVIKKTTFELIRCLSQYLDKLIGNISPMLLFPTPGLIEFRPSLDKCSVCGGALKVQKTRPRILTTLHIGKFYAREVILVCSKCDCKHRSEQLCNLVPPSANLGYDVLVYVGKALYIRHRSEEEVVAELAEKNIQISPRGASSLGSKFIVYLAIAHDRCSDDITEAMRLKGGYICYLDATCEGRDPILISSLDSISQIVLCNIKLPAEDEKHIVPFLQRIKKNYGIPIALVHDMGRGILNAVARIFTGVPDFICHFHFLRDIGKDFLGDQHDIIRKTPEQASDQLETALPGQTTQTRR